MCVGKAIIRLRKEKGFSQESLAIESEVSRHYMYKLENSKASPTINVLEKICGTLNISVSDLIKTAEQF